MYVPVISQLSEEDLIGGFMYIRICIGVCLHTKHWGYIAMTPTERGFYGTLGTPSRPPPLTLVAMTIDLYM